MNDFTLVAIADFVAVLSVVGIVYWKMRSGLAMRLYGVVIPASGVVGYMGFLIPKFGSSPVAIVSLVVIAGVIASVTLFLLNSMVVRRLRGLVDMLASSASQISTTAAESAASAAQQASTVAQVTSSVEEINRMATVSSDSAQEVVRRANTAVEKSQEGVDAVSEALKTIDAIARVTEVVDAVNDLADQSNLLAVNASIEAAKAGEHGRGFSVVATHIGKLAERSKDATLQIRDALRRTDDGRKAVAKVDLVVRALASVLEDSADSSRRISAASTQQSAGLKQITEAMKGLSEAGQSTAAAASQLGAAVGSLKESADDLAKWIGGRTGAGIE